jgi:hypothetical protein
MEIMKLLIYYGNHTDTEACKRCTVNGCKETKLHEQNALCSVYNKLLETMVDMCYCLYYKILLVTYQPEQRQKAGEMKQFYVCTKYIFLHTKIGT